MSNRKVLNQDLINLINQGKSLRRISQITNLSVGSIRYWLRFYKLKTMPLTVVSDRQTSCSTCERTFKSWQGLISHVWRAHTEEGKNHNTRGNNIPGSHVPWNKGLTKNTDKRVKQLGIKISNLFKGQTGRKHTTESKLKMSESMKKCHREGKAWNIGRSRWNNKPSHPEKFFMEVIKNEFVDKDYTREYPFKRYSLDFAWVHKKRCIEIDGEQHERDERQKARDIAKNDLLIKENWRFLRIRWVDMYKDSKHWINIAKEFIDVP